MHRKMLFGVHVIITMLVDYYFYPPPPRLNRKGVGWGGDFESLCDRVSVSFCVRALYRRYLLNRSTFCNQTLYGGTAL